jgi:hypothetical protein
MKRHDTACRDRYFLSGLGIAAGALWLVAQLKIAEARELDRSACFERDANFFEKALDHVFRFALVEAQLFEEQVGEFGFC